MSPGACLGPTFVTPVNRVGAEASLGPRHHQLRSDRLRLLVRSTKGTTMCLLVHDGANVKAMQRMLGRASAAMTVGTYTDRFGDHAEAVATALDHRAMQTDAAELLPRGPSAPIGVGSVTRKTPGQTGGFSS